MSDANVRQADPRNYQLPGGVCLFFRKKGSSLQTDWKSVGNVISPAIAAEIERLEHFSQYRGARAKDREVVSQRSATLNFSIDEITRDTLQWMFGTQDAQADSTVLVKSDGIFTNPGGGGTIDLGTNANGLVAGSVVVRSTLLEPPETTYVVTTDYIVDAPNGEIDIVAAGGLDPGPTEVHIFWEKTVNTQKFEIFPGTSIEGQAQFQVMTPGGIQYVLTMGSVTIINNGDIAVGDGTAFQEVPLSMSVLVDSTGKLGEMHVVDEASLYT